jgi:hypothetical protein
VFEGPISCCRLRSSQKEVRGEKEGFNFIKGIGGSNATTGLVPLPPRVSGHGPGFKSFGRRSDISEVHGTRVGPGRNRVLPWPGPSQRSMERHYSNDPLFLFLTLVLARQQIPQGLPKSSMRHMGQRTQRPTDSPALPVLR